MHLLSGAAVGCGYENPYSQCWEKVGRTHRSLRLAARLAASSPERASGQPALLDQLFTYGQNKFGTKERTSRHTLFHEAAMHSQG